MHVNNFPGDADVGGPAPTWSTSVQAGCVDGMGLPSGSNTAALQWRAVGGRTCIGGPTWGAPPLCSDESRISPMSMGSGHPSMTLTK